LMLRDDEEEMLGVYLSIRSNNININWRIQATKSHQKQIKEIIEANR
jgi:hypothetical protein